MTAEHLAAEFSELIDRASAARQNAHAPYSSYRVGAALRACNGAIFTGCNIENASYGATLCAERVAVAGMVALGLRKLTAIAVFSDGEPLAVPCGICRQVLSEFAGSDAVVIAASPGAVRTFSLGQLFPEPFVLRK